ncbi:MAG: chemotaxis protein CheB, partial [Pseudomonadota bacterium]
MGFLLAQLWQSTGEKTLVNDQQEGQAPAVEKTVGESVFHLVGIGASAGGLEAIRDFVKHLPKQCGAAFVIVQHLSPDHQSLLTTLIDRETHLKVSDVRDGVVLEQDTIYVTPPNWEVKVDSKTLMLQRSSSSGGTPKPSVDHFFRSAAEAFGAKCVGIILSGTGADGAYGIQAIQAAGGITIAQDIRSAKYDGMPSAAIETGCVDLILPPNKMAEQLEKILAEPRDLDEFNTVESYDDTMADLLHIVLAETRVDFRDYKPTTIRRRIERRMTALAITSLREYTNFCRSNSGEVNALFKDLLISVTRFFRDPTEFEKIAPYIDSIVQSVAGKPIRIWVIGCATGEEVYSIAMMFGEAMGGISALAKSRIQIFATDIDMAALDVARSGVYPQSVTSDIPSRFFGNYVYQKDGRVYVDQRLKDIVLFSRHNICLDPPFLNIDLVCCRNLMIYFGHRLQERVHSRLNYSLLQDGYLFLGKSETIHSAEGFFDLVDRQSHLYRKRAQTSTARNVLAHSVGASQISQRPRYDRPSQAQREKDTNLAMFEVLASKVGPNSLLLASDLQIVRVFGNVSPFLILTDRSRLKFDITILRPELAMEARTLASLALKNNERRTGTRHSLENDAGHQTQLDCFPIISEDLEENYVLVAFNRWPTPDVPGIITQSEIDVDVAER